MTPPEATHQRRVRYRVRHQARLDVETHAKLEGLAEGFHRKRSIILRYVMQWGIARTGGWTVDMAVSGTVRTVGMLLEPDLLQQVQEAAVAQRMTGAAWLRHAMRQIMIEDFPASWRAQKTTSRSHDSGASHRRFMLRLNEDTSHKLETLTRAFDRPAAEVIRQLITQAHPRAFPQSWHLARDEQRQHEPRSGEGDH
jgi:predicted transcriptional regulator